MENGDKLVVAQVDYFSLLAYEAQKEQSQARL